MFKTRNRTNRLAEAFMGPDQISMMKPITLGCNIEKHHYYVEWKLVAINLLTCYNMEKKNLKNKNKIKLATIE